MDDKPRIIREHEVRRFDRRPMTAVVSPFIRTVFSDFCHNLFDYQTHGTCGKIELNFMRCYEAYGANRGFFECRDLVDDYRECTSHDKQFKRYKAMYNERKRQYLSGERPVRFSKPPRMGSAESTEYKV